MKSAPLNPVSRKRAATVSAINRLKSLPDVFTLFQLASTLEPVDKPVSGGVTSSDAGQDRLKKTSRYNEENIKYASVLLARWSADELVAAAGPRTGVYYNLLKIHEIDPGFQALALRKVYEAPILMGESVLHAYNWTTQPQKRLTVAVLSQRNYTQIDGIRILGRPLTWFEKVVPLLNKADLRTFGLQSLPPAVALADLYAHPGQGVWNPKSDDFDIEADQAEQVIEACKLLNISPPEYLLEITDSPSP